MAPKRVSQTAPVQVYLDRAGRDRLDQLADRLDLTRSDVLRRGLVALERESLDPASHPVLRLLGTATESGPAPLDVAREHDRFLAGIHEPGPPPSARPGRRKPRD